MKIRKHAHTLYVLCTNTRLLCTLWLHLHAGIPALAGKSAAADLSWQKVDQQDQSNSGPCSYPIVRWKSVADSHWKTCGRIVEFFKRVCSASKDMLEYSLSGELQVQVYSKCYPPDKTVDSLRVKSSIYSPGYFWKYFNTFSFSIKNHIFIQVSLLELQH